MDDAPPRNLVSIIQTVRQPTVGGLAQTDMLERADANVMSIPFQQSGTAIEKAIIWFNEGYPYGIRS
jgi:hypothetical protein